MGLLELRSVSKSFGGTPALRGVSLKVEGGERVGLIGENGAGKTTLIKILAGVHRPDEGEVVWEGASVRFGHPLEAMAAGISTIHQELAYFEKLTVAENMMMGERWPRRAWGGTNWRELNAEARRRLESCGLDIDPRALFQRLSAAQRQEVAIARALAHEAKLVVLDEPSASLTEPEVERLFAHLERLRARGVAMLYVSHRLDEILKLTDRVVVLRDGARVAEYPTAEAQVGRMVRDMVGRDLELSACRKGLVELVPPEGSEFHEADSDKSDESFSVRQVESRRTGQARETSQAGKSDRSDLGAPVVLSVEGLEFEPLFRGISFSVHAGEVLGLGGLIGAGRSEVARAIFGLYGRVGGRMELRGEGYSPAHPAEARERGVVYVPEERKRQGFVLEHSLREGISIGFLRRAAVLGVIPQQGERARVASAVRRFGIQTSGAEQAVGTLSGGNQQKALLARWLETETRLVILDEPTRGVDVGAKAQIHGIIRELAAQGKGVILISSDLPELLSVSDRILVLREGRIAAELQAREATQEKVLLAASGLPLEPQT